MKKIISLLMICFMLISMTAVVSADTGVTFSVVVSDELDMEGIPYYLIAIQMDKFYTETAELESGYVGLQLDLSMDDSTKGVFLDTAVEPGDVTYSQKKVNAITQKVTWSAKDASLSVANQDSDTIRFVSESPSKSDTVMLASGFDGGNTLGYIYFMPSEEVTGKLNFTLSNIECAVFNGTTHYTDDFSYDYSNATIDFGGEPVPPTPVATTVKTFAKRLYLDNTLYTVGVISEGTDYATETIKAGIRIDKAGVMVPYWTNNAPVSDGKGTSYYAVALNGVTAETDITAESASKAVITVNGGAEISGDEVSANDTSVE